MPPVRAGADALTLPHRLFAIRFAIAVAVVSLVVASSPAGIAAQPASVVATPEAPAFHLVAKVRSEEWMSPLPALETGADIGDKSLLEALREGGFVIYIRHASTDFSTVDEEPIDLQDCATQRTLSEVGRVEARRIGESIVDHDIPVGDVYSSEMCRAWETAELAFGEVELTSDLTAFVTASSEAEEDARTDALRTLLGTPPESGTNTFVVGHLVNITIAANVTMEEGEATIFLPTESRSGNGCIDAVDVVD